MQTLVESLKQPHGIKLTNVKRTLLIGKMYDLLQAGYMTDYALKKQLKVNNSTIQTYRPLVDDLLSKRKLDRTVIRNLELQRAYKIVEMLMEDLSKATEHKDRIGYYNQIAKHSSRIALITGLNIETQVNVDQRQLVIIRADNHRKPVISLEDDKASLSPLQPATPQKASK